MPEINWNLLQVPDIGGNALAAFERGQQIGRQRKAEEAYATYATNPDDPNALNALAQFDPKFVMGQKQQQAELQRKAQDDQRKAMLEGVEKIGQAALWADTPEKWDRAVDYLSQFYPDIAKQKGKFTPELRMSAIASAGEMKTKLEQEKGVTVGPGSHLVDPVTGKPKFSAPFAPRPVTLGEGQTAFDYRPGTGETGNPAEIWQRMIHTESRGQHFKANGEVNTSPAGAIGIAQVMPGTAPEAARLAGVPFDDNRYRNDPAYNEQLGQAYFQAQLRTFGDPEKAVAAYNAGPGNVQKAVAKGGENWKEYLPAETKGYLNSVFGGGSGMRVIGQGAPKQEKPKWRQLSPDEVAQRNLPPGVYQESPDGEVKPLGTKEGGKGSVQEQARGAQLALQAAGVKGNVDPVADLIRKSTSGGLQTFGANLWSNLTGDSTDGMEAIGALATIGNDMVLQAAGGSLGAQISNSDRDFMAARFGDIANPEKPVDMRLAAWKQVKARLNALASAGSRPAAAPAKQAAKPAAKKPTVSNW